MSTSDKLMQARVRLLMRYPWYGHFAMRMLWKPSQMEWLPEEQRTMGVRMMSTGDVECLYYPPFVDSLTVEENYAVVQHEIEHVVRLHCLRRSDREGLPWNVACDMTINGMKASPRIGYEDNQGKKIMPLADSIVWIPKDWPYDETAEYYYDRMQKESQANAQLVRKSKRGSNQGGKGKGEIEGEGEGGEGENGGSGRGQGDGEGDSQNNGSGGGKYGHLLDDHSIWQQSDMDEDAARQLVKNMVEHASSQSQGRAPGHLVDSIKALDKPFVRWREVLRAFIGRHVGNYRMTYARRNRRRDEFGVAGKSHRAAATATVIVDTSGSIGTDVLGKFFAEIDSIAHRTKVNVLQWDHGFQGYGTYRRGDWRSYQVKGRGGTDMAAPVRWLKDNRMVSDVNIMLTDGYCQYLPSSEVEFPFVTVISDSNGSKPDYGQVIVMQ